MDALKILTENKVKPVGGWKNLDEAFKPIIIKKSGLKIAFLAFSGVFPYNRPATKTNPGVAYLRDMTEIKKQWPEQKNKLTLLLFRFIGELNFPLSL